jgi:hypothetical protein
MSLVMVVSFVATRLSPETLNRDLTDPDDAVTSRRQVTAPVVAAELADDRIAK